MSSRRRNCQEAGIFQKLANFPVRKTHQKNNLVNCPGSFYPNLLLVSALLSDGWLNSFDVFSNSPTKYPWAPKSFLTWFLFHCDWDFQLHSPSHILAWHITQGHQTSSESVNNFTKYLVSQREARLGSAGRGISCISVLWHTGGSLPEAPDPLLLFAFLTGSFREQPQSSGSSAYERLAKTHITSNS